MASPNTLELRKVVKPWVWKHISYLGDKKFQAADGTGYVQVNTGKSVFGTLKRTPERVRISKKGRLFVRRALNREFE